MGGIILSLLSTTIQAQQDTSRWDPRKNPTVDSIMAPYQGKLIPPRPAPTTADIYPAIGRYESTTNMDAANVSIMLDEQNRGIVWIEGLPQGKIKAMLRKSPSTYKIPAQKTEAGKDVAEGTLIFDKETNTLSIVIGKPYNVADPAVVFAAPAEQEVAVTKVKDNKTKTKTKKVAQPKAWTYVGTKVMVDAAMN